VQGSGFGSQSSGFRVQGSGFVVQGSGFRIQGSGFGVQGSHFNRLRSRGISRFACPPPLRSSPPISHFRRRKRELFIDNLLVRVHFIILMIRWTGLAPYKFEFPFPGSLTSTFLLGGELTIRPHGAEYRLNVYGSGFTAEVILRVGVISEGGGRRARGGVPREQKMLKGHLPRVIYHQVY